MSHQPVGLTAVTEQMAQANGIEIAYDTFGDPDDPTLLLIMGLALQLIHWDPELCGMLAERGFHVVRFDNRDVGLSTKIEGGRKPNILAAALGFKGSASYKLDDMAADAVGLLDHLGVRRAHLVGPSMGGMIAQALAVRHPERVASLCSIMSTTGKRFTGMPRLRALGVLLRQAPRERDAYIEYFVRMFRVIGSPGYPTDEARIRELAAAGYDRCHYNPGVARQLVASMVAGDRTADLKAVRAPTLVIHGMDDPLITLSGGLATARAVPGARLLVFPGMGHDLPRELWPDVVDAVARNAGRAAAREPTVRA